MRTIRYKNITVKVDGIKPTICSCCGNKAKPRGIHFHHIRYSYTIDEVRNNPKLALDNTICLCFSCHRICNCIRILEENKEKAKKLMELIK